MHEPIPAAFAPLQAEGAVTLSSHSPAARRALRLRAAGLGVVALALGAVGVLALLQSSTAVGAVGLVLGVGLLHAIPIHLLISGPTQVTLGPAALRLGSQRIPWSTLRGVSVSSRGRRSTIRLDAPEPAELYIVGHTQEDAEALARCLRARSGAGQG